MGRVVWDLAAHEYLEGDCESGGDVAHLDL